MDEHMRLLLGQSLALIALIGATIEYAELAKRRAAQRVMQAEMAAVEEAGLRGLVRALLIDDP
jgi:hypothetical protein